MTTYWQIEVALADGVAHLYTAGEMGIEEPTVFAGCLSLKLPTDTEAHHLEPGSGYGFTATPCPDRMVYAEGKWVSVAFTHRRVADPVAQGTVHP